MKESDNFFVGFAAVFQGFNKLCLAGLVFNGSLCCSKAGNGNAERAAGHIVQTDFVEELDRGRIATMLTANTEMDVRAGFTAELAGHGNQFANTLLVDPESP